MGSEGGVPQFLFGPVGSHGAFQLPDKPKVALEEPLSNLVTGRPVSSSIFAYSRSNATGSLAITDVITCWLPLASIMHSLGIATANLGIGCSV